MSLSRFNKNGDVGPDNWLSTGAISNALPNLLKLMFFLEVGELYLEYVGEFSLRLDFPLTTYS
jgi:hypothetical protein